MQKPITQKQKELLEVIYTHIRDTGYPPTFEEMRGALSVVSNQSVIDYLEQLAQKGMVRRNEGARGLVLTPLAYEILGSPRLTPFLGITSAGSPIEAIEISGEWEALPSQEGLARLKGEVYMLKIFGDSMINAGINNEDIVLVQTKREFSSGEIVLAQVGEEMTVKRFISEDKPPYLYLKPENPKYDIIYFTEDVTLKGKIISVLQNEQWKSIT